MTLPAVAPHVTAELVEALSPRLRKRLDAAAAKLRDRPPAVDGDVTRIALDDDTVLELHAPGGSVATAEDIRCGCLLAPACVHRAAAASAAPVAEAAPEAYEDPDGAAPAQPEDAAETRPDTDAPQPSPPHDGHPAADVLWTAGAAVLETGIDGAGAVLQAELLRAAHVARLAALPRPAAAAVRTVNQLRAARAADPEYRLADLSEDLRELLTTAHQLRRPHTPPDVRAAARGTARRAYAPGGSLRVYGLCTEPVITATGHAGAVTWVADAQGRLYSVPDLAPGGPSRAVGAASRAVRMGDTSLTHRELARAGLVISGATVSADGRLGAGKAVQAVRASGADWTDPPLDRLWAEPVSRQLERALGEGPDLLFLEATLLGTARETGGDCLLADCQGVPLRLTAAHEHPELAHRDNLRALAGQVGLHLRLIGRLVRAGHARVRLLAVELPSGRHDLGLDRLQRSDLPEPGAGIPPLAGAAPAAAPLHVLERRTQQAVAAGRRALALPGTDDAAPLRHAGLTTAAELLAGLRRSAADRGRDHFGRLLPADADRFARAWLAAALYADEAAGQLCRTAWAVGGDEADGYVGGDEAEGYGG
ncbi:hypothetical protein AB0M28_22130 [Streptomyces sp. NPDC051940]|uniref:hypothetical protein n=1 Tax=Streptomyces sp. NPDC051940 TaxID=3155675 RepID=UPI00341940FC